MSLETSEPIHKGDIELVNMEKVKWKSRDQNNLDLILYSKSVAHLIYICYRFYSWWNIFFWIKWVRHSADQQLAAKNDLKRGWKGSKGKTPKTEELQYVHLANVIRIYLQKNIEICAKFNHNQSSWRTDISFGVINVLLMFRGSTE